MTVSNAFVCAHADWGNGCVHAMGISRFIPYAEPPMRAKLAYLVAELIPDAEDVGQIQSIRGAVVDCDGKDLFGSATETKFSSQTPVMFITPLIVEGLFPGSYLASLSVNGVRLKSVDLEVLGPDSLKR